MGEETKAEEDKVWQWDCGGEEKFKSTLWPQQLHVICLTALKYEHFSEETFLRGSADLPKQMFVIRQKLLAVKGI